MNISHCPRCHETVRVPQIGSAVDSYAQCPWCSETYPLSEILDRLPPLLTILSDEQVPAAAPANHQLAATDVGPDSGQYHNLSAGEPDDFELTGPEHDVHETVAFAEPEMFVADSMEPVDSDSDNFLTSESAIDSPVNVRPTRRKKSGGGLRSLIGIVGGGLLAVPIAGAIMWALGIGFFAADNVRRPTSVASNRVRISEDPTPAIAGVQTDDLGVDSTASDISVASDTSDPQPSIDLTESPSELTMPEESMTDTPTPNITIAEVESQPDSDELVSTAQRAIKMIGALNEFQGPDEKRTRWLTTTYQTIASAAEMSHAVSPSLGQLADTIERSKIVDGLEQAGADWIEFSSRSNDGVLLIGQTDGMNVLLASGKAVTVAGDQSLPASGRILVMGQILDSATVEAFVVRPMR